MTTFARWISIIAHPFVMVAAMVAAAALKTGTPAEAARVLVIVLLVTVVPVAVLMIRQVRRGAWDNADASNRSERPILFAVGIVGLLLLLGYLFLAHTQSFLIRGASGTLAMLAVSAIATRWLKVSLHMAFATLATTALLLIGSTIGWVLLAVLPFLAWSRLVLSRHKLAEVIAGVVIGFATGMALKW